MTDHRTVAILGDIGGHSRLMERCVRQLGGDPDTATLPDGLTVVQVGDLMRLNPSRGAGSDRCVQIADRMMRNHPGQWVQLFGNHEVAVLGGHRCAPWYQDDGGMGRDTIRTLRRWWQQGEAALAWSGSLQGLGDVLVTHGGLTAANWEALGRPIDPAQAAGILNESVGGDPMAASQPGVIATGQVDPTAGVLWAEAARELLAPWVQYDTVPFSQVYGHATVYDWDRCRMQDRCTPEVTQQTVIDVARRRVVTTIGQHKLVGVDWTLAGWAPEEPWEILRLPVVTDAS